MISQPAPAPAVRSVEQRRPRVTIVMTARERHSLTEATIESVVAETDIPYRFIYCDAQAPQWLRDSLADNAATWKLEVVRFDEPLWPHEARKRIAPMIDTDYAVFIDNDVQVEPGWLEALGACADETGAGIVGPLYLWGDDLEPAKIHMAGGKLFEQTTEVGRVLDEMHYLFNADPKQPQVQRELVRRPCDFVEFHCMLIRTQLLGDTALFDPAIRCVHEHIDVALRAVALGLPVYFEPAARVQYMAYSDYMLDDLEFFRERWAPAEGEASIAAFSSKWNVIDDARSFGGVRDFLRSHVAQVDPLRSVSPPRADRLEPMLAAELAQSRSALLDLALGRGYPDEEIAALADAYRLAQRLFDAGYRPCGRPFINHVTGVAAVLVRYDFALRVVLAGLLHAAYTHAPRAGVCAALGGERSVLERRVRAYAERASALSEASTPETLSTFEAEILAIEAANEVDMHLSGEFRYTERSDAISDLRMRQIEHVCRRLGVPGLSATLANARGARGERGQEVPAALRTGSVASYRFATDGPTLVPMITSG